MGRGSVAKPCFGQALFSKSPQRFLSQPGSHNKAWTQHFHTSLSIPTPLAQHKFLTTIGDVTVFQMFFSQFSPVSAKVFGLATRSRVHKCGGTQNLTLTVPILHLKRKTLPQFFKGNTRRLEARDGQSQALQHGLPVLRLGRGCVV